MATAPLIVIVGETGSGKSALALELAQKFNGEIIAADSRTVYMGMDIGTAKPSAADQTLVKHHLLDIIKPSEDFNVAEFKQRAQKVIDDICKRSKLPIMVGGTGLYIDSVLFDYQFSEPGAARDSQNPRHLKSSDQPQSREELQPNTLVLGLQVPKEVLKERLIKRLDNMLAAGFEDEVRRLAKKYGWGAPGLNAIGYREWQDYLKGQQTLEQTKELIIQNSLHFAKRQRTWFKRNKSIHWVADTASALAYLRKFLIEKRNIGRKTINKLDA